MEAWQRRECKQQKFIEKLAETVRDAAEDSGNYTVFMGEFLIALLRSVISIAGGAPLRDKTEAEALRDDIIAEITRFELIEGEMAYLIGRLLDKLSVSIYSFSQRKYQSNCISDPETAYGPKT